MVKKSSPVKRTSIKKSSPVKRKSIKKSSPVKRKSMSLKGYKSLITSAYTGKHGVFQYIKKNPKKSIATSAAAFALGGLIGTGLAAYSNKKEKEQELCRIYGPEARKLMKLDCKF
jgi:hypothetical protein